MDMYVNVTLNPTDNVKCILAGNNQVSLYNVDTLKVIDCNDVIVNAASTSSINGTLAPLVIAHDEAVSGQILQHAQGYKRLLRGVTRSTYINKTNSAVAENSSAREDSVTYTVTMYESAAYETTLAEVLELMPLQNEGVFYDLLPVGTSVDTIS